MNRKVFRFIELFIRAHILKFFAIIYVLYTICVWYVLRKAAEIKLSGTSTENTETAAESATIFNLLFHPDFIVSFAASAIDSLIFFTLIGIVMTFISIKHPKKERYDRKVEYLFPDVDYKGELFKYLLEQISSLACITESSKRRITLRRLSENEDYIDVLVKTDCRINNIHPNHIYSNNPLNFSLDADKVDFKASIIGEIQDINIIRTDRNGKKNIESKIHNSIELTNETPTQTRLFDVSLDPDENVFYQTKGWFWQKMGQVCVFSETRYTLEEEFIIKNDTLRNILIKVESNNINKNSFESFKDKVSAMFNNPVPEGTKETSVFTFVLASRAEKCFKTSFLQKDSVVKMYFYIEEDIKVDVMKKSKIKSLMSKFRK